MAGKLNADLLKNLNENFERMNKELSNVSKNVKTLSDGFKDAKADVGSFVESLRSISTQVNALKQLNIKEALGIDTATVAVSDLKKKLVELEGETSLGVRGSAIINKKSGKWKFRPTEEKIPAEEQSRLIEQRNSLRELVSQLDKGKEKSIIDLVNLQAKQTKAEIAEEQAKQQALQKTIALYNQYAEKYKELGLLIKQETKSGKLTDRGKELQDEQKKYRDLAISEAQAIRKARIDGVKLSQEEELRLEVAHQQALRKTRERLDKQGAERAGTKGAQERAIQEKSTRSAVKEINKLLDERAMKESNLAKEGKTEKYYDTQRRKIEEINKKIEEQKRLLGSYGKSGERALGQLGNSKDSGTIKQLIEDTKALEAERKRLVKLAEDDAKWHEQQRKNIEAIFAANGKAINQQERLAAKIDELSRKRDDLLNQNLSTDAFGKQVAAYNARINNYEQHRQDLEKQFPGSATAGQKQYLESEAKAALDAAEARKKSTEEAKKQAAADREAAMQAVEAKKKIAQADKESIAVQKRQVDIKNRLRQIDNDRAARAKFNKSATKQEIAAENQEYKHLSQELTKLIARQKELDAVSKGSGRRARTQLESYEVNQADKAARRYANTLRKLDEEKNRVGESSDKLISSIKRLGSAFGIAFSVQGLVQFGRKLVETRSEFEMQFVAMKQIIGDVDAATKIWNQTMQQALQSPFRAMQLVDYTKKLAAYRIETEKLFDTTKRLADVSAGLGVDMGRLILAYGQVKSANFLRASEVRQFTEAGVNIYGELAEYLSEVNGRLISTAEVAEMVQKRMVSFADIEEIFKRMTDEGGIFYNMQEVQADTVKGQINKLHDAYDQMLNTIGQANQGAIRDFVEAANDLVRNWRDVANFLKLNASLMLPMIALWRLMKTETYKTVAANTAFVGSMKHLGNSFKYFWRSARPSNWGNLHASIRGINPAAVAGATGMRILNGATRVTVASVELLKGALRTFAPFLLIEGLIWIINKAGEATRAKKQLEEDLSNIRIENSTRVNNEIRNYDKLVKKFNELNQGSLERQEVISKLNSQYGKYIGFEVTETTTLNQLAEAQERVNKSLWENARARAEEEQAQRIEQDFLSREQKLLKADRSTGDTMLSYRNERGVYQYLNPQEAKQFSEYVKVQMPSLTSDVLENADAMQDATKKWLEAFFGVTVKDFGSTNYSYTLELMNLYVEEEKRLREEQEKLSAEFSGMDYESLAKLTKLNSDISTAIATLTKSKIGEEVDIESLGLKIKVPTDLGEKTGVWEAIKEEINRRKDDFVIDLKFSNNLISEEQRGKLKDQAKTTGDMFVDTVNKEIADNILKSAGIEKSLEELKRDIIDNPEQIQDWDAVNHALELTNTHLIKSSDIVNGISTYTKMLAGNLEVGRTAIDDAVRAQGLLVNGTEEEVKKAQEVVDKARERYKWLLRIAKLIGLETKAADEIVAEQGYDLSVGDFRKQNAILALQEKFGKATNDYGKKLSNIGVTENLKSVADAYHKQDEELQGLIKNQEKALENETNLKEVQKRDAQQNIENLKVEQQMAEFLANYFGYVAKQRNTRNGQKESISSMLSLLREMNGEYEKLSKSAYGYAKSQKTVSESYRSAFMEIYKGLGMKKGQGMILDFETTDFTTKSGLASAYQKLLDYVSDPKRVGKYAKDAVAQIEKALSQIKAGIDMDVSVRIREDFGRQMEEAFGNYELTLDLQKLNLSNDVLSDLFGIDAVELPDLRSMVAEFYYENAAAGADPTELVKQLDGYYKKIDDMERKQQHERIKEYAKYLEYELSERAKIEMEYTRKYAEVSANQAFTPEQKKQIQKRLGEERDKALAKQEWEDFKGSETYIQIMEDLEHQGVSALAAMRTELERIKKNAENLSPRALKEVVNAIEKIDEISIKRGMPIGNIVRAVGSLNTAKSKAIDAGLTEEQVSSRRAAQQTQADINARLLSMEHTYNVLQSQLGTEKEIERLEKERYQNSIKLNEEFGEMFMWDGADEVMQEMVDNRIENIESARSRINDLQEKRKGATEDETKEIDQQLAAERANLECLEKERGLLLEQLKLNKELLLEEQKRAATPEERKKLQERIDALEKEIKVLRGQADAVNNVTKKYGILGNSITDAFQKTAQWGQQALDVFNSMKTMMTSLGVDTDTDAWDDAATAMETLNTITSTASSMAQKIESGDWVGAVMDGVKSIMDIVSSWAGNNDASLDRQIRKQQERIEELQRAYQRLEKQIEKTWSSLSYMSTYEKRVENIKEQIEAIERQRALEEAKKNTDNSRVREYTNAIEDAYDELEELKQKKIEVFGGIGEGGYRSAAEGFVDAWKSAFLETGDGLQGLQDHFDEFLQDWFVKQATMRVAGKMLEHTFNMIDESVSKDSAGGVAVTTGELRKIRDDFAAQAPLISEALEQLAGTFDLNGEGKLSGLAAGIQGMTEEQANILEAYWNSVRMYTANIDVNVERIAAILGAGGINTNPMLDKLDSIINNTSYIKRIYDMVEPIVTNNGSGRGFRTYAI